jgi:NAD(P)H-dependent FMN reductase
MTLYLPILYGSVREPRRSIHVARFALERLALRPGVETRLFDPRDLPFGNLVHREWEWPDAPDTVQPFVAEMARADGFVIVTPEYNHGYTGTLKNLFDHLSDEWHRKPFALVGAGGIYGGARAIDGLRMVIPGLGGVSIPAMIGVTQVETSFGEAGPTSDRENWERRFDRLFTELEWYALALQRARQESPPPAKA